MIQTSELIVRIGNVQRELAEASARGFYENTRATQLAIALKEMAEKLEELALSECVGRKL